MKPNVVVVTLTIVVISLLLSACHHGRHRNTAQEESRAIEHLAEKLDLSPGQKAEVARVQSSFESLKEEGRSIKEDWYDYAIKQFETDSGGAAESEFPQHQAVRMEKLGQRFANTVADLKSILTTEQEQVLIAELKKHDNHRRY